MIDPQQLHEALEHARVSMSIAPLVAAGAVYGVGKLLSGLFGGKSKKKKADAAKRAEDEALVKARAGHEVDENRRVGRLGGVQQQLQGVQGSLAPGAPSYAFSPEILAALSERRPFTGSAGPDPRAGLGYELLSGLSGDVAGLAGQYGLSRLGATSGAAGAGGASASPYQFNPSQYQSPFDRKFTAPILR